MTNQGNEAAEAAPRQETVRDSRQRYASPWNGEQEGTTTELRSPLALRGLTAEYQRFTKIAYIFE